MGNQSYGLNRKILIQMNKIKEILTKSFGRNRGSLFLPFYFVIFFFTFFFNFFVQKKQRKILKILESTGTTKKGN